MVVFPPHLITEIFNSLLLNDQDIKDLRQTLHKLQMKVGLPKSEFVTYLLSMIGGYHYEINFSDDSVYISASVLFDETGYHVVERGECDGEFKRKVKEICRELGFSAKMMVDMITKLVTTFENYLFSNIDMEMGINRVNIFRVVIVDNVMLVYM